LLFVVVVVGSEARLLEDERRGEKDLLQIGT
jgi:hypothetical protein